MFMVARENLDGSGIQYPPALPNDRGSRAKTCTISLIIGLFIVGGGMVAYEDGIREAVCYTVIGSAVMIFTYGLLHFARRNCLLVEEFYHIPGRYLDKKSAVLKAYKFNMISGFSWTISTILTLLFWASFKNPYIYLWTKGPMKYLLVFAAGFFFSDLIRMEESTLHTSLQIEKMNSLDYGSGMAYNFFYGYLRLVLPDPEIGTDSKGIKKRIETFINYHRLPDDSFPLKKLFILIPQNLYTPTDLSEVSTDWPDHNSWMEAAVSLEPQELDRAGVKKRVYKNSVYKIRNRDNPDEQQFVYVVAEGATPLKTFYDVIMMNPKMSHVFKDHQHEIVSAFYKTLLDIIKKSDDCRDVCEIIYYVDTDLNKKKVNVARIILERIHELTRRNSVQ